MCARARVHVYAPWNGLPYDCRSLCGREGSKLGCPGWTGAGNEDVGAGGSWDLTGPPSSSLAACVPTCQTGCGCFLVGLCVGMARALEAQGLGGAK